MKPGLGRMVLSRMLEAVEPAARSLARRDAPAPLATDDEPPIVARLVVEVRSDGSRTIARGALEDAASGEQVAIRAEGTTPAQLAASLARSLFSMPLLAAQAARALRDGARGKPAPRAPRADAVRPVRDAIETEGIRTEEDDEPT
jgi:hypothetical protein